MFFETLVGLCGLTSGFILYPLYTAVPLGESGGKGTSRMAIKLTFPGQVCFRGLGVMVLWE